MGESRSPHCLPYVADSENFEGSDWCVRPNDIAIGVNQFDEVTVAANFSNVNGERPSGLMDLITLLQLLIEDFEWN